VIRRVDFASITPRAGLTRAQVHRSSMRNLRGTLVGGCTVSLVVRPQRKQSKARCRAMRDVTAA
jgi:hypothetical protein